MGRPAGSPDDTIYEHFHVLDTIKEALMDEEHYCREERMTERNTDGPWDRWRLNRETNHLELYDGTGDDAWKQYEIDLDRCDTPMRVLSWIFHVSGKHWAISGDTMYHLLDALYDLGYADGVRAHLLPAAPGRGTASYSLQAVPGSEN